MPSKVSAIQLRLNNITTCLTTTVETVQALAESLQTPFLQPISSATKSLLTLVQTVKQHKKECAILMEQTNELLYTIAILHIHSDITGELAPSTLNSVGDFTLTLHKIHAFVEAQQEGNNKNRFFRRREINGLLRDCKSGMQRAYDAFKIQTTEFIKDIDKMEKRAADTHKDVLDFIESLSNTIRSDASSSVNTVYSSSFSSSTSLSLLPSKPKIFHGRESELSDILQLFVQSSPRIAILGAGGIGKTSLARAVLHESNITFKYGERRFFVACDSTSTTAELIALVGVHLALKPGKNMARQILHTLSSGPPCLLILDNLETAWEPHHSRKEMEDFLSHLADIQQLALIITMRGAERPSEVYWTRPFLPPLQPLTQEAARRIFVEIADQVHNTDEVDAILQLTDNMPLAIDLMARVVDSEGFLAAISRWEREKTGAISEGYDRKSNLDISIALSLSSPRLASLPQMKELLSLLSVLPDGLSDAELVNSSLPIANVLGHKAGLLRTSLAYTTAQQRLKVLVPIREYMQRYHPPPAHLVDHLSRSYEQLLGLFSNIHGTVESTKLVAQIGANFANIQSILSFGIQANGQHLSQIVSCAIHLMMFSRWSGHAELPLMSQIATFLAEHPDHKLEISFISECLRSHMSQKMLKSEVLIERALGYFPHLADSDVKCRFYNCAGQYYQYQANAPVAKKLFQQALVLANSIGNVNQQFAALYGLALIQWNLGDHVTGQEYASKAQQAAKLSGNLMKEAAALRLEAICLQGLGDYFQSIVQCKRARSLLDLCGMSSSDLGSGIISSCAEVHKLKSEYSHALDLQKQVLHYYPIEQNPFMHASTLCSIAEIDIMLGTPAAYVQQNLDTAQTIFKNHGAWMQVACEAMQGDLDLREGNLVVAKQILEKSLRTTWGKYSELTTLILEKLGDLSRWAPKYWNYTWPTVLFVSASKLREKQAIYKGLQFMAYIPLASGGHDTATSLLTVALEGFTEMDIHRSRAECMFQLGVIAEDRADFEAAARFWNAAMPLFARSSQGRQVALTAEKLVTMRSKK